MADILEIANLVHLQLNPKGSDETPITLEEVITAAQTEAANMLWLQVWNERNQDGYYTPPSYLLKQISVPIKDNEADISSFGVLTALPKNIWLQRIGSLTSECNYVRNTVDQSSLLLSEDDRGHGDKTYIVIGSTISFPNGVHENPLRMIVASLGEGLDGSIQISDDIASAVTDKLLARYLGKIPPEDVTNNSSPNT